MIRPVLVLALAAATPVPGAPAYQDLHGRFSATFPAGWHVVRDRIDEALTSVWPPGADAPAIQVVATDLAPDVDLDRYVRDDLAAAPAGWMLRSDAPDRLGPLPARKLVLERRNGAQVAFRVRWVATAGKHVYVLTGSADLPAFPAARARFDAAAAGFRPGDWAGWDAAAAPATYADGPLALVMPAGWRPDGRREGRSAVWRRTVDGRLARLHLHLDGYRQARAVLDAEKQTFADEPRWQLLTEEPVQLGGRPGLRLVSRLRVDDDVAWEARYLFDRGARHVMLRFEVEAEAPPPALQAELDAILASVTWR